MYIYIYNSQKERVRARLSMLKSAGDTISNISSSLGYIYLFLNSHPFEQGVTFIMIRP